MRRGIAFVAMGALLGACSADSDPTPTPATSEPTASASSGPSSYDVAACPVEDEAFCTVAAKVIEALQIGDVERLFFLSRRDRLVCADLATEYFPGCLTQDVLVGYGSSGANFLVEVLDADGYRRQLESIVKSIDPTFADELGDGAMHVVGVGTCGPDIPGRRTYHLAWTAAVGEPGAPPERVLGSFELTFEGDWQIALWYLSPLDEWEVEQPPDPLELAFCEAGRTPWPDG